jgi:exopolysaccharide production protein ExoY
MSEQVYLLAELHPKSYAFYRFRRVCKLLLDICVAGLALVLLAPIMLLICVLIRLSDGGPVLYKQPRIGAGRRPFNCLKFRSMVLNADSILTSYLEQNPKARAEWETSQKLSADPRVTRIGLFLRRTSLDELPQLFNVVMCDMSLVGPRPVTTAELPRYGNHVAFYLCVRPGVTGLWQISGRSECTYTERVLLDVQYVRQWRLSTDFLILIRTIPVVLYQRGSC